MFTTSYPRHDADFAGLFVQDLEHEAGVAGQVRAVHVGAEVQDPTLAGAEPVDVFDLVRLIAVARIALPGAKIRLSAGRTGLSEEAQALCFFAGANSIFYGDKLLTAANPQTEKDLALMEKLDLVPQRPNPALEAPAATGDRPLQPANA